MTLFELCQFLENSQIGKAPIPPLQARISGFVSLVLWFSIIAVGRIFAYHL